MPEITIGKITHLTTSLDDDSATAVLLELHKGAGSEKCPRTFEDWQDFAGGRFSVGTIAGKAVTLVIGDAARLDIGEEYRLISDSKTKGQMNPTATSAIISLRLESSRAGSLANLLAAQIFVHGSFGQAGTGKKKRPGGCRYRLGMGDMGAPTGCYGT